MVIAMMVALAAQVMMAPATVADLGWMAGAWEARDGARWTEEMWTAPRAGQMMGVSRGGDSAGVRSFEYMRIEAAADGTPIFRASPGGKGTFDFPMVEAGPNRITFANPAHDYPQRISYVREGDALTATIALTDGSKAFSYRYRRR